MIIYPSIKGTTLGNPRTLTEMTHETVTASCSPELSPLAPFLTGLWNSDLHAIPEVNNACFTFLVSEFNQVLD